MSGQRYTLDARVSSENPAAVQPVLERLFGKGSVTTGTERNEVRVRAKMKGTSARDLNRFVLSELRRTEKRTRLRAEWTSEGTTERFFDYVPKGRQRA